MSTGVSNMKFLGTIRLQEFFTRHNAVFHKVNGRLLLNCCSNNYVLYTLQFDNIDTK